MKVITLLLSLFFLINNADARKNQAENLKSIRIEKVINSNWTFNYFPSEAADKGYESPGFNDTRWPAISLPHTWNSFETTGELRPFTRSPGETGESFWWTGWGWYRKHFSVNADLTDKKLFIEFEGVQKYCKVWINGRYIGDHKGGYGSFDFDITGFINAGADNLIAVAVSYLQKDEFRIHPVTEGKHNVSCGICRNVRLVLKNTLFIPMQGSASHEGGTFISTPSVSEKEAVVNVKTWVKNDNARARTCTLQTIIAGRNKEVIQVLRTDALIDAGQLYMFDQSGKPVKNPHLWSAEDPYLYTIVSEVIDGKETVDSFTGSFGFRSFRHEDNDKTIYLNDKKIELTGVNHHQEYPWLGDAIPGWMTENDYSEIAGKEGYNFIRTINYPGDKTAYEQADKHGIIIEEDFSAIADHGFSEEEQRLQIREMIRRDRNHPGIISWSVGDDSGRSVNAKFAGSEDSTRMIRSVNARIDSLFPSFYSGPKKRFSPGVPLIAGEPAKIILRSSHNTITADRGSVAIILADVTDSKGNYIPGAKNNLMWRVSGPAKFAGPASYVSYADSNGRSGEGWYTEMPAANILRSSGKPGKITVTVFSGGLASGSCVIDAEEIKTDNSFVSEPVLADAGRKSVVGSSLVAARLDEIPQEITIASGDFNLAPMDKEGYTGMMRDYIKKNNPSADTLSVEFNTLADLLAGQLYNNGGILSAADYNFNAEQYNNCRLISGYIASTKLPLLFKESLREYYSKVIIRQSALKNAGDEMNWLNWIPSGGIVVIAGDEAANTGQKGVVFTRHTSLPDIIKVIYPRFTQFSDYARERALVFISKMNPSVHAEYMNAGGTGEGEVMENSVIYTAEKGKPILIPEYKFISE